MLEDFEREHEDVFAEATAIYKKRSAVRGQMWLTIPISRKLDLIEEKLRRAEAAHARLAQGGGDSTYDALVVEFEDSLLDLINTANFAIKQGRRERGG